MRRGGIVLVALLLLVPARGEAGSTTKTIKAPFGGASTCVVGLVEQRHQFAGTCQSEPAEISRQTGAFSDALLLAYAGPGTFDSIAQLTAIYSSIKMGHAGTLKVTASLTDGAREGNSQYCLAVEVVNTGRFSCANPPKAVTLDVATSDMVVMGILGWNVSSYPIPVYDLAQGANVAVLNSITFTLTY